MKEPGPRDPMELVGVTVPGGDLDYMAECLIDEYMLLGWSDDQLESLFKDSFFHIPHQIYLTRGDAYVCSLIRKKRANWSIRTREVGESDA